MIVRERSMTPEQFRECLATIGWRVSEIAAILSINGRVAARWASGARDVPPYVADWLRTIAAFHTANALPDGWAERRNVTGDPDRLPEDWDAQL